MRISAKADYAVRAAIELAAAPDGKAVPAERIATSQGIPLNFLEHILLELRIAGVVRSQRGTDGGYRLAKEPRLITIADIIRAVEGPLATVRGGKPEETEYPGVASQLPREWIAVRKNLRNVVEHVTVADIANARLPDSINVLADDPEAWVTRQECPPRSEGDDVPRHPLLGGAATTLSPGSRVAVVVTSAAAQRARSSRGRK